MKMISTREVTYEVDGLNMVAYLARPEGEGPWPAVLIGHDGVGLEDYQKGRADDLAAHGYVALAMDYHGGQVFFGRPEAMPLAEIRMSGCSSSNPVIAMCTQSVGVPFT